MESSSNIRKLLTEELHLDRSNPRLAEHGVTDTTPEKEVISLLWEIMDVQELVQSIVASGYFEHEPLIVAKENGKNIVIEGNRRLAAVKILLDKNLANELGCKIRVRAKAKLEALRQLPVEISTRENAWRYLGFKHINGPAKWSSYAKAQYIADIHRKYKIPLPEIANQIGDRHKTVQRLYRGLMVIEQAETEGLFHRDDRYTTRFAFSHLYTGLDYDGIYNFLSLKSAADESRRPVPKKALENLGELCIWLYGSRKSETPPLIQSQNPDLRRLDSALKNKESLAALRSRVPLVRALEIGREPEAVLEDALLEAKRALQHASGYITTGYKDSKALLQIADDVSVLANDVFDRMERSRFRSKQVRRKPTSRKGHVD